MSCDRCGSKSVPAGEKAGAPAVDAHRAGNTGHGDRCPTCGQFVSPAGDRHLCPQWYLKSRELQGISLVKRESSLGTCFFPPRDRDQEVVAGNFLEIFKGVYFGPFGSQAVADEWIEEMGGEPPVVAYFAPYTLKQPWEHFPRHQTAANSQPQPSVNSIADSDYMAHIVNVCNADLRKNRPHSQSKQWLASAVLPVLNAIEARHGRLERSPLSEDTSRRLLVDIKAECETNPTKTYPAALVRKLAMYGLGDTDFGWVPASGLYFAPGQEKPALSAQRYNPPFTDGEMRANLEELGITTPIPGCEVK